MNINQYFSQFVILTLAIFMAGCATTTTPPESADQSTEQPSTSAPIDYIFPIDLQTVVDNLVTTLLESRAIGGNQPTISFNEVKNNTKTNLDTKAITNQIRTQLTNSGKVQLIFDNNRADLNNDKVFRLQDNNRPLKYRFDQMKSKNYRMIAVIHDNPPKKYNLDSQYYRMTISLLDMNTGNLLWIDEKENIVHSRTPSVKK